MQRSQLDRMWRQPRARWISLIALSLLLALIISACQPAAQPEAAEPAPAAAEPTATEAAPTEEPAAEPTATPEPEEEATATPEAEEEPTATAEPEEEATAEPEAESTATPEPEEEAALPDDLANGQYIINLTGGCGCHFNPDLGGLAGGRKFEGPYGVIYAANLTSDETGLGSWSPEEIALALQTGARPDGSQLHPVMPYRDFSLLSDQEALNVAAYLLSLDPIANEVPARELASDPAPFTPANEPPAEAPTDPVARGQELVTITRCGSCHTPRNPDGSVNADLYLAGGPVQDEISANITPHESTGVGKWSEDEIAHFMVTGEYPDGGRVTGAMAQQIDRRFSTLTDADALAIAAYLKSIPPISHDPYAQ